MIDEEHDGAYKNEEGFRYHARSLAARRARAAGCPLVLGSATPSLETRYAAERGALRRLVLSHRIGGRPLPAVELVDLAKERAGLPRGRKLILTRALAPRARRRARRGRPGAPVPQPARLLDPDHLLRVRPRRALPGLRHRARLPRRRRRPALPLLRPPRSRRPDRCPGCGSDEHALLGVGTERVEEEVRARFPEARIARLDRDVAVRRGATEAVLRGAARAARSTSSSAPRCSPRGTTSRACAWSASCNADLGLHLPDFRAAERTFQLLTQVAGRAGRGGEPGRVIVQTWVPEHYALRPVRGARLRDLLPRGARPARGPRLPAVRQPGPRRRLGARARGRERARRRDSPRSAAPRRSALAAAGAGAAAGDARPGPRPARATARSPPRAAPREGTRAGGGARASPPSSRAPRPRCRARVRAQVDADPYSML